MNKPVFLLILSLLITIIFPIVSAQDETGTEVGGVLNENTTWTLENSPYFLTTPLLVNSSMTLTIEPGVTVYLTDYYIRVAGTLNARGTPTNHVSIICNSTAMFTDVCDDATIQFTSESIGWNEQTGSGSIIENAIISSTKSSATIYIFDSSPKINNSTVINTGGQRAIFIEGGDSIISNCSVISNFAGITYSGSWGQLTNGIITGNIISDCEVGIEVYSASPVIEKNLIINNNGNKISGAGGIRIDYADSTPSIRNNTIIGNSVGFNLIGSPSPTVAYNNILGNQEYAFYLYAGSGSDILAANNWWGTTDVSSINQSIRDFKNDFNLGTVTFVPFLMELNPNAPTLPLRVDFIHSSEPLYVSRKIDFDASACYGEYSNISSYFWDFGDENTTIRSTPIVTHTYTTAGAFHVTLTVTDEYGFQNGTQKNITVLADDIPPTTSHDYDGLWHTSDFTITLSALDSESGVEETHYQINEGETRTLSIDGQPFITTESADNKLEYWSEDISGNVETVKVLSGIKLDKTNPIIGNTVTTPEGEIQANQDVKVAVDVSDSVGGVESVTLSYSIDNWSTWENLPMNLNSTNGLWQATIPGQEIWTTVNYKILCYDNAGNDAFSNGTGLYYEYQVISEFPSWIILPLLLIVILFGIVIRRSLNHVDNNR